MSFRPGARSEIRAARRWYEAQVPGLGRAFLGELDATLAFVLRHPAMYEAVEPDGAVRRALLHRFPYALVYEAASSGDIVVLACFHVRQDAQDWPARR
ncbi:type II toxin-antitoxin system RelE/ParE family toxin [Roseisolibacter sp. H3M3-2]|uniref:type II toxin-antitoxin system RelE/ParE family toxin n=1 Tax=Roseisolibacter sp. H3M3-2 TaxID=3031323 RepID=UPI0023DBA26F|nr:type II toxin-antitoxin system RelE/ParE family toxin [Roseisolibacter sp. H3M3-2]MDF1501810.1 type II toxin-antitoxin system RelE/ParE family toxin [Roseisolibacter sp. H3M3-2]